MRQCRLLAQSPARHSQLSHGGVAHCRGARRRLCQGEPASRPLPLVTHRTVPPTGALHRVSGRPTSGPSRRLLRRSPGRGAGPSMCRCAPTVGSLCLPTTRSLFRRTSEAGLAGGRRPDRGPGAGPLGLAASRRLGYKRLERTSGKAIPTRLWLGQLPGCFALSSS